MGEGRGYREKRRNNFLFPFFFARGRRELGEGNGCRIFTLHDSSSSLCNLVPLTLDLTLTSPCLLYTSLSSSLLCLSRPFLIVLSSRVHFILRSNLRSFILFFNLPLSFFYFLSFFSPISFFSFHFCLCSFLSYCFFSSSHHFYHFTARYSSNILTSCIHSSLFTFFRSDLSIHSDNLLSLLLNHPPILS